MLVDIHFWELIRESAIWTFAMFKLFYLTIGWKTLLVIIALLLLRRKIIAAIQRSRQTIP